MNLAELLAKPVDRVVFKQGFADTYPNVKIGGQSVQAFWLDGVYALVGDSVWVAQVVFKDAPPTLVVTGTFTVRQPREGTVTAAPGGSATITVTASGQVITATFLASYTPTVNDAVRLFWQGSQCTVLGKVGATPAVTAPPPSTTAPPPPSQTGQLSAPASDSATWTNNWGWNAGARTNVYQGDGSTWGGASVNNGAWFYNGFTRNLSGLTVTRVRFKVPQRLNAGFTSSAVNMHLYIHNSDTRPAGDVSRIVGPNDIGIDPNSGGGWVDLPVSWGTTLAGGGGIGISGNAYAGWAGIGQDASSGQLLIDWSR